MQMKRNKKNPWQFDKNFNKLKEQIEVHNIIYKKCCFWEEGFSD